MSRTSVFWTLVKDFVDFWSHLILRSPVCKSCSHFVSAHTRESKVGWLIAIWLIIVSDQCFLNFGEGFRGYLILLVSMEFCWLKKLRRCFSTCLGSENPWAYWRLTRLCLGSVFQDFGEEFRVYLISLVFMEFCSLKKLRLCFSTDQRSENPLVYCNLTVFALDQYFLDLVKDIDLFDTWFHLCWWNSRSVLKHIFNAYCNFKSVRGPSILLFSSDPRTFKPTVS